MIEPKLISLRDMSEEDIPPILDYWYRSPIGFIEAMGVDLKKLPQEQEMEKNLRNKCMDNEKLANSKLNALVILYQGRPIGVHTVFPLDEDNYGIFHAHIWEPEFRRRGIAQYTYPMACRTFLQRFNLRRILFKTPHQNTGAIRAKEKLGIRCIGEEIIGFGIIKENTRAKVFELTREEAEKNMNYLIRRANLEDADGFYDHLCRHFSESGNEEDIIFQPSDKHKTWVKEEFITKLKAKWSKPCDQVGWEVVWVLEKDGDFLGHVDLSSGQLESSLHRSVFGMGLERKVRRQGWGRKLAQQALDWIRQKDGIDWVDLNVFTHNLPALKLYESLGFSTVGATKDVFRLYGKSIDDIHMVLNVKKSDLAVGV